MFEFAKNLGELEHSKARLGSFSPNSYFEMSKEFFFVYLLIYVEGNKLRKAGY